MPSLLSTCPFIGSCSCRFTPARVMGTPLTSSRPPRTSTVRSPTRLLSTSITSTPCRSVSTSVYKAGVSADHRRALPGGTRIVPRT